METELVTIALCAEGVDWRDQDIYIGDGWNLQPSNDFLGFTGRVISKQVQQKPDWLDLSFADAKEIGIIETISKGFWILEIDSRTVVACFGGSEDSLNPEKLDSSFLPYRIEVKNGNLKSEVLEYMKAVIRKKKLEGFSGSCDLCGLSLITSASRNSCDHCGNVQDFQFCRKCNEPVDYCTCD